MLQRTNVVGGVHTTNRCFAKGRNLTQRAMDMRAIWESFRDPVALSLDHSKFDAHYNLGLMKVINQFNASCFSKYHRREFVKLARAQMYNKGTTRNGTKFFTVGTRMSGDQNTGSDNSEANFMMTTDWLNQLGITGQLYVDGDDEVVVIERSDLGKVDVTRFSEYGMNTKLEGVTDVFEHIDFCQCRPVFDGVSWRLVRNPLRVLTRLPWLVKAMPPSRDAQWLKSIGMCELALGVGLPVMQAIACKLIALSPKKYVVTPLHSQAKGEFMKPWRAEPCSVRPEARASYERAWGITPEEQLQYEALDFMPVTSNIHGVFEDQGGERPYAQ